jgi:uncharacterized membrane protein
MGGLIGLWLLLALFLVVLFPILFAQLLAASMVKLHLGAGTAILIVIGMFVGGMINIPVRRITRHEDVVEYPFAAYGFGYGRPGWRRHRRDTVIAVNVGGCVIPVLVAAYELAHLDPVFWMPVLVAAAINIGVCYALARPVPGVGITIPGLVPGLVAALLAYILAPADAAPVAFIAGVAGPLIGADFLHLNEATRTATGVASIGGAGTFDGIVLSGVIAAYLT